MSKAAAPVFFSCSLLILLGGALALASGAWAHESRPAYLEINETAPGRYDVLWRTPLLAGMRLPVVLTFPDNVRNVTEPALRELPDSLVEHGVIETEDAGLGGTRIEFTGLQGTITDVLVRVQLHGGASSTTLVHPSQPWVQITAGRGLLEVAGVYLRHGVEHILFGYDHLLFVCALMLIVLNRRVLLITITAFTIAHSITLALATLGMVHVPGPPVEAAIAVSILLLAIEIVRLQRGEASLTARWPWVVAFSFGLLHGFGFASALADIGLPHAAVPLALLFFNLGVEAGQLLFIAAVLALLWVVSDALNKLRDAGYDIRDMNRESRIANLESRIALVPAYAIGSLAMFWIIQRLAAF
jgi:hydrogenase/urease accessory protein HupE